ncbi:MAG: alpha-L-fucosidase [Clostridia bacterium]|nr:alpha-L-fucosidase [Clostridia bacterium]
MSAPKPLPYIKAFEQLGFGMFVHFGLYSKLNAGEWTFDSHKRTKEEYEPLKDSFCIDREAIKDIVQTAKEAGCKYITFTTRHHEGFSLYDTKGLSDWDIMHTPTGRDIVKEYVEECRKADIVPFFYHTTLDWWNDDFEGDFEKYLDYLYKSVELLCTDYGKIGGMWFDGNWSKPDNDWKEGELYSMIRRNQPEAIIVNNTGIEHRGETGISEIDSVTYERGLPAPLNQEGRAKYVAGEMCETLCDHWGVADDINFKPVKQLIEELCECRKVGANFLLNIGPDGDGYVPLMQKATMQCIGRWMDIYGKAIYNGRPFLCYNDRREFMLRDVKDEHTAYLFILDGVQSGGSEHVAIVDDKDKTAVFDNMPCRVESIKWMDNGEDALYKEEDGKLTVAAQNYVYGKSYCVRVAEVKLK